MQSNNTERDLTLTELSKILGFSKNTLLHMAKRGDLPGSYMLGKRWRFRRESLNKLRGLEVPDA